MRIEHPDVNGGNCHRSAKSYSVARKKTKVNDLQKARIKENENVPNALASTGFRPSRDLASYFPGISKRHFSNSPSYIIMVKLT